MVKAVDANGYSVIDLEECLVQYKFRFRSANITNIWSIQKYTETQKYPEKSA
ncbi:hypothetical protein RND71_028461 [Anisodus tanguticus]|uniref:Uncharacterized protein n=1 Tax=Anisodus tanguticus TaxID=243964 RepID=A0AAE1V1L9_9SOLA|nr:hypothetical protein RND71_028461 [Anisodus tanguticus]